MTDDQVRQSLRLLYEAGYEPPKRPSGQARDPLRAWLAVFATAQAADLDTAVHAWMQADSKGFWPKPGQVRQYLPARHETEPAPPVAPTRAVGEWLGVHRRNGRLGIELLDRALDTYAPCDTHLGRLVWNCESCTRRIIDQADRLAEARHEQRTSAGAA